MIDIVNSSMQMAVIFVCEMVAFYDARTKRSRLRLLYGLFLLSIFLGDLWWVLGMVFYGGNLGYSLIPYINWKVALLFLILMMQQYHGEPVFRKPVRKTQWLIPVFCGFMCAGYMTLGAYLDNVVTAILMSVIIWNAVQRLIEIRKGLTEKTGDSLLCKMILIFCALEYAMWTASCLNEPWYNLYYVFDAAITVCYILFIPAVRKAVRE
ncbi:MAG: hypothetical protein IKS63_04595 [Firmicutes bacterium]|nr:hypothetical protein [Bacillota bacterium]